MFRVVFAGPFVPDDARLSSPSGTISSIELQLQHMYAVFDS